ncbi:uncharacterized protein BDZ99DRAFT_275361 [Mytilinidion resinicola]|uniref:Spindle pole body-associated protein cut12 domain-containing protein n=1 Tax=Mytilinidion resinicola TaxID=574789 RepID=A0A6A6YTV0_9PEZI|nr:uncharacterized protein BDZ99DRAFT_275361 [Mytilinidion resinicola]KAF2811444.1 hypothetical protein BDZ99DRAFT_275361 [Mytilinidion resinicola]
MFSWITGPRITNVVEDLQSAHVDTTYIDPPDTPAPVFAVKAFKQALFGTPHPDQTEQKAAASNKNGESRTNQLKDSKPRLVPVEANGSREAAPVLSPVKNGILMTPGTAAKGRKTVSFGAQVAENAGKKGTKTGKSGIPNDCPGKFPSPWTPGTELLAQSDKKPRTKLTAALYDARDSIQTKTTTKPRAKDDQDLTLDYMEPRSASGKYWKEQFMSYSQQSEHEMRRLIKKEQIARSFARKKDGDATELTLKLEEEQERHRQQEKTLEEQMKDYQERLRQAMAENARASMEISMLKQQLAAAQQKDPVKPEVQTKNTIRVHEDPTESVAREYRKTILTKPVLTASRKEDSAESPSASARPRRPRRSTAPESNHPTPSASGIQPKSNTPLSVRLPTTINKENLPPKSPSGLALPSSSDCWMPSSPMDMDRMALPISSAPLPARSNSTSKVERSGRIRHLNLRKVSMSGEPRSDSLRQKTADPASLREKISAGGETRPQIRPDSLQVKTNSTSSRRGPVDEDRKRAAKERLQRRKANQGVESRSS